MNMQIIIFAQIISFQKYKHFNKEQYQWHILYVYLDK